MVATVFLAKPAAAASPDTLTAQQKQLRVIPTVGEQCNTLSEPGFFFGGKTYETTPTTCDVKTTPFCDKENKVCVQCLTPDKTGYDKSKACGSEYACIKGRCVSLETPLPKLFLKDPKTGETRQLEITGPASYILYLYNLGLRVAGVLAFLLVLFYGALYIVSAGDEKKTGEYKEKLGNVLVGVIVLLGSYIILQTINPTLTQLKEPQYKLKLKEYVGVCIEDENKIELWTKNKLEEEEQKTKKKFRTYSETFVGLPCTCEIVDIFWGTFQGTPLKELPFGTKEARYTVLTSGCQKTGEEVKKNPIPYSIDFTLYDANGFFGGKNNEGRQNILITGDVVPGTIKFPEELINQKTEFYLKITSKLGKGKSTGKLKLRDKLEK